MGESTGKKAATGIVALFIVLAGGIRAFGDDIGRILGHERPPPIHVPEPRVPREPLPPVAREPIPVPRLPAPGTVVIHGQFPERPEWWDSFLDEVKDRTPDALDYLKDAFDAVATTKCTAGKDRILPPPADDLLAAATGSAEFYELPSQVIRPMASAANDHWFDPNLVCTS